VHEVNTAATGLTPGRRMPAWARRSRASSPAGTSPAPAKWILAASRLIFIFTIFAIAALLVSAAIGYGLAHQNDTRLALEQHSALRNAVAEFRSPFGPSGEISPSLVRVAEHVASMKNLKFVRDPEIGDREVRPVMDAAGRIGGFFTWDRTNPMMRVMGRLASFFAIIAVVLFGFAALSLWQLKRARRELHSERRRLPALPTKIS
jgi:hypothetical protein